MTALIPQQPATPAAVEREKEVYRIYSTLLTNPATSHGADNNPRYLIRSVTKLPLPPQPCVQPPMGREEEFAEILADFEARKGSPRTLTRQFTLRKPYQLLSPEQANAFQSRPRTIPLPGDEPPPALFQGVSDLFTLSDVYFSKNGRLALTSLSNWCGGLCAQWEWKVLQRETDGSWKGLPWVTCGTIARLNQRTFANARYLARQGHLSRCVGYVDAL